MAGHPGLSRSTKAKERLAISTSSQVIDAIVGSVTTPTLVYKGIAILNNGGVPG